MVSKRDLYTRLRELGFDPSDDQIDALRPTLVGKSMPSPAGGRERFVTIDDANRILVFYHTCKHLQLKKPRIAEIAFWMAAAGFDVPGHLVADHIVWSVNSLTSQFYRVLASRADGTIPLHNATKESLMRLGKLVAKGAIRLLRWRKDDLAHQILGNFIGLSLRATLNRERFPAAASTVMGFLYILRPSFAVFARQFWDDTLEVTSFFVKGEGNALVRSVREARLEGDAPILRAAKNALLFGLSAGRVFPFYLDAGCLLTIYPSLGDSNVKTINRYMLPWIAAVLLCLRDNEFTRSFTSDLEKGRTPWVQDLAILRDGLPAFLEEMGVA
jgi:hypothetical protein